MPSGFPKAFRQGLRELGYLEGTNILIEYRGAGGHLDRIPSLVAELVQLQVDVLVSSNGPAVRAAKQATTTIPIVMALTADPVAMGLIESLARPGGNITGLTTLNRRLTGKRLEVLTGYVQDRLCWLIVAACKYPTRGLQTAAAAGSHSVPRAGGAGSHYLPQGSLCVPTARQHPPGLTRPAHMASQAMRLRHTTGGGLSTKHTLCAKFIRRFPVISKLCHSLPRHHMRRIVESMPTVQRANRHWQ
jgi:hypothetical protein